MCLLDVVCSGGSGKKCCQMPFKLYQGTKSSCWPELFEKALSFRISLLHHQIEWLPRDDTAVDSPGGEREPEFILESAQPHTIDWAASEVACHLRPRGSGD